MCTAGAISLKAMEQWRLEQDGVGEMKHFALFQLELAAKELKIHNYCP